MKNSKKNSLLKRGSALLLVLATVATTLPSSGLFADELATPQTEETQEVSTEVETTGEETNEIADRKAERKEAREAQIVENAENAETPTEPVAVEPVSLNTLYAKVSDGGYLEASVDGEKVTLSKSGDQILRTNQDGIQENISEQARDGYYPVISKEGSPVVKVDVKSESGFKIESYRHLIDSGEEDRATFETLSLTYTDELTLDSDKFLSAVFVADSPVADETVKDENEGGVGADTENSGDPEKSEGSENSENPEGTEDGTKSEEPEVIPADKVEEILEEQIKEDEEPVEEVPEEPQYYQKNEDGSWDYSTFPVVREDEDEGTIVLGPDGVEYPVKYLYPTFEFLGKPKSQAKSMLRSARNSASVTSELVMITRSGITDQSGSGYTNVANISNGATGICVTGVELFPHNKTAIAERIPGSLADTKEKRFIAMFLTNEDRTAVRPARDGVAVPSARDIGGGSSIWALPFGSGGFNPSKGNACSWLMANHIFGSWLSYEDARYNPLGAAGISAIGQTCANLDAWIASHQDLINRCALVRIRVGGSYQTISYLEVDDGVNIDVTKTIDGKAGTAEKSAAGCRVGIYATKDQATTANENARKNKPVANPIAYVETDQTGNGVTKVGLENLKVGTTYYATEIIAPNGYGINKSVFKKKLVAGETWSISIDDTSGDPYGMSIFKCGRDGLRSIYVNGAIFRIQYYQEGYDKDGNLPSKYTYRWYIKTLKGRTSLAKKNYVSYNGNKSDPYPTGGYQPGIYVFTEVDAPDGFNKMSGNLVVNFSTDKGWEVLRNKTSNSYLGNDLAGYPILKSDASEGFCEIYDPVKYYGFKLPKVDVMIYNQLSWKEDSRYKWSSIYGVTQGSSDFKNITFDVYNWSGSSRDNDLGTLSGKHDVSYKPTGADVGYKEKVCTLTVDPTTGIVDSGKNLSEGFYKIVENAEKNPSYGSPIKEYGNGVWYITLSDETVGSDNYYLPHEQGDKSLPNADGYHSVDGYDDDGQNPWWSDAEDLYNLHTFFAIESGIYGDMIALKIDKSMYNAVDDNGNPLIKTGQKTSFADLLYSDGFGFTLQEARGQLQTLENTRFRVINNNNNNNKVYSFEDVPDNKLYREVAKGGAVYKELYANIYCVDFLKSRYRKAWDRFDEELKGDIGVAESDWQHGHQCSGGCKKYVCAVVLAHEVYNCGGSDLGIYGSLPEGDYILEEYEAGDGYKVLNSTPFKITPNKCTLVQDTNIGKGYFSNEPKKIGVVVQKVVETDPNKAGFAPGDTSLEGAEFSIINRNTNSSGFGGFYGKPETCEYRVNIDTGEIVGYDEEIMRIRTNAEGIAQTGCVLPVGGYEIREVNPSEGTKPGRWIGNVHSDVDGYIEYFNIANNNQCEQVPIRGGLEIYKLCNELKNGTYSDPNSIGLTDFGKAWGSAQGDGYLSGIKFQILNASENPVPPMDSEGPSTVEVGDVVGEITTKIEGTGKDMKAVARTEADSLVYGTYQIKEVATNGSYLLTDGSVKTVTIREEGVIVNTDTAGSELKYYDNPRRGGISVTKADSDMSESDPTYHNGLWAEGDATRAGAEFQITNRSSYPVIVDGTLYNVGEVVKTIKTNADGFATTANNTLPYGTYEIQETKAPTGYLVDTKWNTYRHSPEGYISVTENNTIVELSVPWKQDPFSVNNARNQDPVIRGGVQIIKKDKELEESEAIGGKDHGSTHPYAANLNGVELTIKNVSTPSTANKSGSIYMPENVNGRLIHGKGEYRVGEDVMVITTHWNEAKQAYTAETGIRDLPYGTYEIRETKTNKSYKLTDDTVWRFRIREDGKIVTEDINSTLMTYENYIIRGDFNFNKVIDATGRSVSTPWLLTNTATGERHIIVTDANGSYQSRSLGPNSDGVYSFAPHSMNTNGHDWLLDEIDRNPLYTVTNEQLAELNATENLAGLWFSKGEHGSECEVRDDFCALPYGEYILAELRCETNVGMKLTSKKFYVTNKDEGRDIPLGTIDNHEPEGDPEEIYSVATDFLTEDQIAKPTSEVKVRDKIYASNLKPNETYYVTGYFMDFDDEGEHLKNNGRNISAKSESVVAPSTGYYEFDLNYTFNAEAFKDRTGVFYAYLYRVSPSGKATRVAEHEYVDDPLERMNFAWIPETVATDYYTGDKVGTNFNHRIVDKVSIRNMLLDRTYRIDGEVREKDTGIVVATSSVTFTPKAEDEIHTVEFMFNHDTEGKDYVVFEDVKIVGNGASVADHVDMNDEKQTVHYPKVRTKAIEQNTMSHVGTVTENETQIKDTVSCTNLIVGKEYTISGKLMNKNTGKVFKVGNQEVTASKTFVAKEKNENHVLTFTVRTSDIAGQTLVAYEDLYHNDVRVATHSVITDEEQSIHYPEVDTKAIDVNTRDEVGKVGSTQVIDTVRLTNLIPGLSYTLSGVAMDKGTHDTLGADLDMQPHTAVRTFTATAPTMDIQMIYNIDASKYEEKTLVIFENLIFNGKVVRVHNDYNDLDQTVYFPKVRTVALEDNTGTHVGTVTDEETTITDTVKCTNLVVGKKYHVHGVLMNKDTNQVFTKDGVEVRAAKEFTAERKNQNIELTFTVKTADLAGKSLVAYERLLHNNVEVASHTDIEDEEQTIRYPELATFASDTQTEDNVAVVGNTSILDNVNLENLVIGQKYTIKGKLMDKGTKEYLGKDKNMPEITCETTFTATEHEMTVPMLYEVDASLFEGKTSVVFENLYVNGKLVREHERFEDENQTVYFPKIRTTALDDRTGTHVGVAVEEQASYVVDTVSYWNLVPGKEYTLNGVLMNKDTNEPWLEDGEPVRASKTFIPEEPNGSVELKFELLYPDRLAEKTLVAFEDLLHNNVKVTTHSDITDEEQTIHYPELKTSMLNTQTGDEVGVVGKTQFKDTVHLTNLIPGQEYSILGTLMDKDTEEYLGKDFDMPKTQKVETFVADTATMDVDMVYDIDASLLENKTVVAFEDLIVNGVIVRRHNDIEDLAQTNWIPKIRTTMESEFGLKDALADYEQKLVDTVPYWNLVPGKTYTLKGTLMVKETGEPLLIDGEPVTAEDTFVPETPSGERKLTFVIKDASVLENKTTVAFEDLQHNGITVTTHSKIDDYDQSVRFPKVRTFALDAKTDLDEGVAESGAGVYDTVKYDNLEAGATYTVKGTLMDKSTGKALEINGKKVEGETTFKVPEKLDEKGNPESMSGEVKVKFELDASSLEGKTLVVFERLFRKDIMVGHHEDINDENQDIKYIKLRTNAIDSDTGINDSDYTGERTIIDNVKYWNATIGNEYTLKAVLMDKETNKPLLLDGKEITSEKTFIATSVDGEIEMKFVLDASALEGKTIVAFERMYREGKLVAIHADIKDKDQSIYFPKLRTTAVHNDTVLDEGMYGKEITLVDQVKYDNLKPGREYILKATMMDKATGEPFLVDGEPVVGTVTFTAGEDKAPIYGGNSLKPEAPSEDEPEIGEPPIEGEEPEEPEDTEGSEDVETEDTEGTEDTEVEDTEEPEEPEVKEPVRREDHGTIFDNTEVLPDAMETIKESFTIDSEDRVSGTINVPVTFNTLGLAGKDVVFFEELLVNDKRVGHHTDIEDDGQTVGFPAVTTDAKDGENETHEQQQQKDAVIIDVVEYTNLTPGKSYTVNGVLMDKETNEPVLVNGEKVKATTTFTPTEKDGSVELVFKFDSSALAGKDLVAFEEVRREDRLVATHTDIEDDNQTVNIIDIKTLAVDRKTLTHEQQAAKNVEIIDTVSYTNLMVGEEYVLTGYLMNKNTGEQLFIDDEPVEGTTTFIPEERDGEVEVHFTFNSKDLAGIDTVVFEQLWHDGVEVATHTDINDEGQTVDIIQIKTNATDSVTGTHEQQASKEVVVYDDVTYTNLVVGKEYEMFGKLMNKETGEPLTVNGEEITSHKKFTPTERNGVVRLKFTFDSSALAGTTVVAFEDLHRDGIKIATHANINDRKQTVEIIDIKTTATDLENGTHEQQVGEKVTVVDWVEYTNLTVGKKYTLKGILMDKSTGKALKVNGKKVAAKKTFVPEEPNGSIDMEFTFNSTGLEGKRLVVFEDLYRSGVKVATHADIKDKGQTVKLINIRTNAVSKSTKTHETQVNEKTTVIDEVTYTGLTVGEKYVVKGVLMNKATGKPLKVDGKKVTAEKKFKVEKSKGSVKLKFVFDSSALAGKTVVVFEDLYHDDIQVATHSDIEDADQSVTIIDIGTVLSDKESGSHTATLGDEITLVDTVKYKGLTPGKKYILKGVLKDKETEGNVAEATAEFVPTESKGFATVEFVVNTNELNGKSVVAFEKLYDEDEVEIANHEDLEDADQTVVIPVKPETPKTGDMNWIYWLAGLMGMLGICGLFLAKKREESEGTEE